MNLWIVNHYAGHPDDVSGASRHQSLAVQLVRHNWRPTIITATTDHSTRAQRVLSTLTQKVVDGVSWRWIKAPSYSSHGVQRPWNMLYFSLKLLTPKATQDLCKPEVIIGSTVHPLAAWSALRLARRHHVPFVFEVRDLWPETLIDMGAIKRRSVCARLLRLLEGHLYKNAALIVTTMPAASKYIATFGIPMERIIWISNGVDVDLFRITPPPMNVPFEFLYCGSHGAANDLEQILLGFKAASSNLGDGTIRLKLVGNGPLKTSLIEQSSSLGISELVEFHDAVPKSEIPGIIESADAVVLSMLPLRTYRFGISMNKLFDYLAAARPILLAGNPVNNAVKDADAGVWRPTNNTEDIAEGFVELFESTYEQREAWGRNGHAHVKENYSFEHLASLLDARLRNLATTR